MAQHNKDFANTSDYITGGSVYPDNGSKLGKFQSAMQIRRGSKLNCENTLAVGYLLGLIVDGDKGNTVQYAKNGDFKLTNIIFAGMGGIGSDNNKKYEDKYYDKETKTYDPTRKSYSNTFFFSQVGNKECPEADLELTDPMGRDRNIAPRPLFRLVTGGISALSKMRMITGSKAGSTSIFKTRLIKNRMFILR